MNEIFEKLKVDLLERLSNLEEQLTPIERLNAANIISGDITLRLKALIKEHVFLSEEEEIHFFKHINPEILSHQIEEGLRYRLLINQPINTTENIVQYYEEEMKTMQSFYRMNNFHYQYYKNNFMELDKIYFLKNNGPVTIPLPEIPYNIIYSCTPMSFLFAQFIAYERTQYFILQQIAKAKNWPLIYAESEGGDEFADFKWTGDITNVVELAYGIYLTGQINHGNASLNQIVRWLEKSLKVNVGIIQKKFTDIERRKRLSITKFLDQMKQAILKKIDSGNS